MPIISNFPGGSGGGSGGLALAAVSDIKTLTAHGSVYVKWTDPDDLVVAGATLAAWGGTLLVRKAGSMPTSRRDGDVVVDSKTRDAYKNTYYHDSGLADGQTYYYKFFPYTTQSAYTDDEADEFEATPNAVAPGDVSGITLAPAGNGKMSIKWNDPAETIVDDGIVVSTWSYTQVVVREDGYATSPSDEGIFVNKSVTRNGHATTALIADGLENGRTYYVSLFPVSTDGGVNTNIVNRATGVADRMTLSGIPAQTGTLTFNNTDQYPAWNANYDSTKMSWTGATVGKDAGDYTAIFTPGEDWMWPGGSIEPQSVVWKIDQAVGTLTVNPTLISLDKTKTSDTFTIGGNYDGTISVSSSDEKVATVSRNGDTVTVNSVNGTTGTATITVSCTAGKNYTKPADQEVTVNAKFVTIYGVQWAGTSATTMTRTDAALNFTNPTPAVSNGTGSSPFDTLMPWSGMKQSTDAQAGEVVSIPKFWYQITQSGTTLTIRIADGEVDGFSVSPAHMPRKSGESARDTVYIGRYHCSSSNYKSVTGVTPKVSITRGTARTNIANLGTGIYQMDLAMRFTIWLLYIVEFADWDSQKTIGQGCAPNGSTSAVRAMGYTDKMGYHTGTDQAARTTYGGTQYRYIEGLWDNCYDWMDGCYYNSTGLYVQLDPGSFASCDSPSGGLLVGKPSSGFPSALSVSSSGGFTMFYPTTASGSNSTYIPDGWYYSASYPCLRVGGSYSQDLDYGLFFVYCNAASSTNAYIGCRLMKLP